MKRLAFVLSFLASPAFAQAPPPPEETIAVKNQQIGDLYFQLGTTQQQLNRANAIIADLRAQLQKQSQPTEPPK